MFFSKSSGIDHLIVGLGNPGKKYDNTRHNAGFRFVDAFAQKNGIRITRTKFGAVIGNGNVCGKKILLMKPVTYMNLSGSAVSAAAKYYKLKPEHITVLCDDATLAPGVIRIRAKGSAGGHNGLQSIIDALDSDDFCRVKIGVGKKTKAEYDLADWVLAMPSSEDQKAIDKRTDDVCAALDMILKGERDLAQSRYNS